MAARANAQEAGVTDQVDREPLIEPAPRKRSFASQALRSFSMEMVGSFIANLLSICIVFASFMANSQAQGHTLLDATTGGHAMLPGIDAVPQVVPDAHGAVPVPFFPGNASVPVSHLYITFPQNGLFIAVGIGFSFALGMIVAPGCVLNPTFSVAVAIFDRHERMKAPFAILGQMVGAVMACWTMFAMGWELLLAYVPGADSYALGDFPKTVGSAGLFGVLLPPDSLSFGTTFLNTVVFVIVMIFAIVPALAGKGLHAAAKPMLVAAVVVPVVMAQGPFGVQSNPAMYIGGLIFASMAGWPSELWTASDNYVVCVVLAPMVGAVLGGLLLTVWMWWIHSPHSPVALDEEGH